MFVKLAVFACFVAVSLAAWTGPLAGGVPADRYPAGISPKACPNFPNCENPAVALTAGFVGAPAAPAQDYAQNNGQWNNNAQQWNAAPAAPQWNAAPAAPQWNSAPAAPQWNAAPQPQWNAGQDNGQWNQQQSWNNAPSYAAAPAGHGQAAQVPAGVDPASCPNYPFCS